MPYAKALRTVRIDFADAGEPGYWCEVEDPATMSWKAKASVIRAAGTEIDDVGRSAVQMAAMVTAWNLEDMTTGEIIALPCAPDAFERLPAHIVEHLMIRIGELFAIPK